MKTVYYDMNDLAAVAVGVIGRDVRVMPAGVTMMPQPVSEKQERGYIEFAQKDVHFIFEDDVPEIDFYAVPRVDVFARTSEGLLATLLESTDVDAEAEIVLITPAGCFHAGDTLLQLLTSTNWKDGIRPLTSELKLFSDRAAAAAEFEFIDIAEPAAKHRHIRRADISDAARLSEIEIFNYRLNFYPIFRSDEFYFGDLQVPEMMKRYEADASLLARTYVYDDGVVKGFMRLKDGELEKLFVEPVLQGSGIGAQLIEYAISHKGAKHMWVLEKNSRAIAFYQRHGFRLTDEKKLEEDTTEYLIRMER